MSLFSLPAEGWVGVEPPVPPLDSPCNNGVPNLPGVIRELDQPFLPCRNNGTMAADLVSVLWEPVINGTATELAVVEAAATVLATLPIADIYVRKHLFTAREEDVLGLQFNLSPIKKAEAVPQAVVYVVWAGVIYYLKKKATKEVKEFIVATLTGRDNRIHPALLTAATVYLDSRIIDPEDPDKKLCDPNAEDNTVKCKLIDQGVIENLGTLTRRIAKLPLGSVSDIDEIDEKTGEIDCKTRSAGHGAAFELWTTANFHMRHEQLGLDQYQLVESQGAHQPAVWKVKDGVSAPFRLNPSHSDRSAEDIYTRYSDIVIKGRDEKFPTIVELKSYPVKTESDSYVSTGKYPSTRALFNKKLPLWNSTSIFVKNPKKLLKDGSKPRRGPTMHRQMILDYILTLPQLDEDGEELDQEAGDLVWLFQDWKVKSDPTSGTKNNRKINAKVGVSMVTATVQNNQEGLSYIAEQLSRLGQNNAVKGRERVAFNLGIPSSEASAVNVNSKTILYKGGGSTIEEPGGTSTPIVKLEDRVLGFRNLGITTTLPGGTEKISEQDRDDLLNNVFGIEKGSDLYKIIVEEAQSTIEEHVEDLEESYNELKGRVADSIEETIGDENAEKIQNILDDLEKYEGEFEGTAEDLIKEHFPEIAIKSKVNTCE